jgi:gamma-glutamylcyclotransferase (GGCT)/AIG2-like uncharacterized protein YtfP
MQGPHTHFDVFVYGTLRRGGISHTVLDGARFVRDAMVQGTLYDIDGEYPALMLYGGTRVPGEIWRCPVPMLARLDRFEGVDTGLFRRVGLRVDGNACWTYVAGPALARRLTPARRLAGGRWPPPLVPIPG